MGQMRFVVPQRERVPDHSLQRAYLAGIEYIPWLSRCYWQDDLLVAKRDVNDSGNLYIPWNVSDHGELVLSTTSLAPQPGSPPRQWSCPRRRRCACP